MIGDGVDIAAGVTIGARAVVRAHARVAADVAPDGLVGADVLQTV